MTPIHFEGIAADAFQADLLMPNDRFEAHRLIAFGAEHYFTTGPLRQRRRLPWHPQTLLIDFTSQFIRGSNFTGYANSLGLDGVVVAVHMLKQRRDKRKIQALQARLRLQISARIARGLARYVPALWRRARGFFRRLLAAYTTQQLPLRQLLKRLMAKLPAKAALTALFAKCQVLIQETQTQIDQLMTLAYMIINPRRVANSSYLGEKYRLVSETLKPTANNPKLALDQAYLQARFTLFQAIQALFEARGIPLVAVGERRHWRLADLHHYTQLGVLK